MALLVSHCFLNKPDESSFDLLNPTAHCTIILYTPIANLTHSSRVSLSSPLGFAPSNNWFSLPTLLVSSSSYSPWSGCNIPSFLGKATNISTMEVKGLFVTSPSLLPSFSTNISTKYQNNSVCSTVPG